MADKSVKLTVSNWTKAILFGDSLTQFSFSADGCWGAKVADYLQRKCDVLNRGFSGYNSRWNKIILPKLVTQADAESIAFVTIFLGANDSVDKSLNPMQHVPLEEYKQNLIDMVDYLQSIGVKRNRVILITPPACDEEAWALDCKLKERPTPPSKVNSLTKSYAEACVEAAQVCGTECVDLYTCMMKQEDWKSCLNDGLHLATRGSLLLFDLLQPILDKLTSELPMIYNLWSEVDNENPNATLDKW
ncbi:hypothetical protein ACJMK2_022547 [Sinanodonta woodiana]|uniref:Isoamyl acetate-hydrolyzing esterase 1 homolog n=1 Tax=Sinanodonta woodiana TaxID=1069815 RepID=A0ABD3TJE6_SINWO